MDRRRWESTDPTAFGVPPVDSGTGCRRRYAHGEHGRDAVFAPLDSKHEHESRRTSMAEPLMATSVFDRLLKDRIIWLGSEVRDENANEICAKILLLAAEDSEKDIYLYINSPGGSITAGMAIYDTMQFVPNDIVTVGIGMAASMGQLLLTSGTKGKRYITPNARVLLHQPHGGFGGTASDIQTQAQLILDMKKRLAEITASQTGKPVEQINADGDRDRWFTAEEALEYGFVDHIREHAADVAGGGGTEN
ncbi:ATP-dependent Clp protease proteolytic subunit [Microbacterium sp. LX3-4]|uniref:ATP-dependent Clp protease proteolytic subunit n=1 Tax=Microbacterium dauci TaxID=3048008 RepID=A0ABT6ZH40_9MICO|nr:ATP-dependent Clp protease proteolytic subunit [Microbacterium sp. LX3-4]MDJ1115258.1 ATP-dependent Clp protease proteolytic subunit [Microbacterium sp. LX3-4]